MQLLTNLTGQIKILHF
ncbi:uncharacterized protein FFMR_13556 [Fusarium fujikuroi]|nr:uncharacterized protein FFMR_13556 [Fusarium fujikuroi]